jgi:tRNA threonylcarbamoyladenosine biosynthesis protein TsaE
VHLQGNQVAAAPERVRTTSAVETEALGAQLAAGLQPGEVVLVAGELGAGKTTLVRGACRALGVTVPVTSPTFTIGQRYAGPIPVSHLDLFRVDSLEEEEPDLLADYLDSQTIAFVEWPPHRFWEEGGLPRVSRRVRVARRVRINHAGGDERLIEIASDGPRDHRPSHGVGAPG